MGNGPPPKVTRRRANVPRRGEWQAAGVTGWQHGKIPAPPAGMSPETKAAWAIWMKSWAAAHWLPEDLPSLHQIARLFDMCVLASQDPVIWPPPGSNAKPTPRRYPSTELRLWCDTMGITPKGQQDRRWLKDPVKTKPDAAAPKPSSYDHLKLVDEA